MGRARRLEAEIRRALDNYQPLLRLRRGGPPWEISGTFDVTGHDGRVIDKFRVRIEVPMGFPMEQPTTYESGERIPRTEERHVNGDGSLCVAVWPEWLAKNSDWAFDRYVMDALNPYLLGQLYVERGDPWPQGERAHGEEGEWQGARAILGNDLSNRQVRAFLFALRGPWPKGHWQCPCGSGELIRHCCSARLQELARQIDPTVARAFFNRLSRPDRHLTLRRRSQWRRPEFHR